MDDRKKTRAQLIAELEELRKQEKKVGKSDKGTIAETEQILNTIQAAVIIHDSNGDIISCNTSAEKMLGAAQSMMLGKKTANPEWEIIDEDGSLKPVDTYPVFQVLSTKKPVRDLTIGIQRPDNDVQWVYTSSVPVFDSEGGLSQVVVTFMDITEHKKAEEELRLSEKQLRQIINLVPHHIYAHDENGIFILANKISADSVNTTEDKMIGSHISEYYNKKDVNRFLESDREVIQSNRPISYQYTVEHKGILRTFNITKIPFRVFGTGEPAVLGIGIDITERKQIEEERTKASKLESIGILAGGIAHDFNNILAAILGNISLAKMCLDNRSETEELLSEVEKASLRAKDLTQQLLTFSKGGAPVKELSELPELINETTQFSLRGSNVRYRTSFPSGLRPADVDKGQFSQVIGNLVINAQQAMPEGGTINIIAENVSVTPKDSLPLRNGNYIKISIEDEGHGIYKKYLSKIFDPYFTTKQKGSGLGLATTYSIIHRHDGYIAVDSEIGVGTTFHIYLPASSKQIKKKEKVKEDTAAVTAKILVMDDDGGVRDFIVNVLEGFGHEVEEAVDGKEAIKIYKKAMKSGKPFEVVFMDLTIPGGMGGKEAIRKLIEIDSDVKAIVSSGYANDPVISNCQEYGFKAYISKPFKINNLKEVLNKVLSGTDKL